MQYQKEFIQFFKELINHKEIEIRVFGVYNLPCFHVLYKDYQESCEINFATVYQEFLQDEPKIRRRAAKSLHEVFLMLQDEDTSVYKEMFIDLLTDGNSKILTIINKNLQVFISNWINEFQKKQNTTPVSDGNVKKEDKDFTMQTQVVEPVNPKRQVKRRETIMVQNNPLILNDECSEEDKKSNHRPNCFITDENHPELIFMDLLEHIMIFVQNVSQEEGVWREHLVMLQNLEAFANLFYMPDIHTVLVPTIQDFALEGNTYVRKQSLQCLAQIITHQHHIPAREEVIEFIISKLCNSRNFAHRRSFITFCCYIITLIPFQMFKDLFATHLFNLKEDKIIRVRCHLAESMIEIKPYYDLKEDDAIQVTELLQFLLQDKSKDVIEATEQAEYEILQNRKKNCIKDMIQEDSQKAQLQADLAAREKQENDERKRRQEQEEENKYDIGIIKSYKLQGRTSKGGVNGSSKKKPSSQVNGVKSGKKVSGTPMNYDQKKSKQQGFGKKGTIPSDELINIKQRKATALNGNKDQFLKLNNQLNDLRA